MARYEIRGLKKSFFLNGEPLPVLSGLDLTLEDGSFTVIVGRSGCGKTTLLRILAGLEACDGGSVTGTGSGVRGVVFQEPRLMPWLTVEKNVAFGMKHPDSAAVEELISAVHLQGFEKARPAELSGGMQHRAALARALALDPDVLLMDEPFAALDSFTRLSMQELLMELYERRKVTIVFVTHSIDEALLLGGQVVLLENGRSAAVYDLSGLPYPRDVTSPELGQLRREILCRIMQKGT